MKFFVESINRKIWNVITNNYLMSIFENVSSEREYLDCVAMNIIVSALDSNESVSYTHLTLPTNREV